MILYGTAPHLWYLPYAFIAGLGAALAIKHCNNIDVWLIATLVSLFICQTVGGHADVWIFDAWTIAIPAVLFGLVLASGKQKKVSSAKYIYSAIAVALTSLVLFLTAQEKVSIAMFVASVFLGITWMIRIESTAWLEYLAGLTFGVYLTHSLFLKLVWSLDLGFNSLINAILATGGAMLLTALLQITPLRRFV